MTERPEIVTVLELEDEYTHEPDAASNYNESMYLNGFDLDQGLGAWFRLGNRVNEGYAEMSVCLYLPDGRVGFMFGRPKIEHNDAMHAGGLEIAVVTPFEHLTIAYEGKVVVLDEPEQMTNPREAFRENPMVECRVQLDVRGVSPMYGGKPMYADGTEIETDAQNSFAKAHYEQHTRVTGTIEVGDEAWEMNGLGLRDKSWGPRYWQALSWYRWTPMIFDEGFALMLSIIGRPDGKAPRRSGMVLEGDEYHHIVDCRIESEYDELHHQTGMRMWAKSETGKEYEISGRVNALIPLRNRRKDPEGNELFTRITEAMTTFECEHDGVIKTGMGMTEYLDQVVDGVPIGPDYNGGVA